ncbi:MAG: hypothetical protein FT671_03010 [Pantoea sp. Brub]|nr:hypothetical protein [Pantoea sp. Brub]
MLIKNFNNNNIILTVSKFGENKVEQKFLNLKKIHFNVSKKNILQQIGIVLKSVHISNSLHKIENNSPASNAGLKSGDTIIAINNHAWLNWQFFVDEIKKSREYC